jgi:TonB family protein
MKLTRNQRITAPSRRAAIVAVIALGATTCAAAMSLRLEVPVQAIVSIHTATPVHAIAASGQQQQTGRVDQQQTDRVAAGVVAGRIISKPNPVYPQEAREQGIQGAVVLHAIIGEDGTIKELVVISGPEQLQASAIDAVRQWVYKPYLLNGEPQEVETTITVNYNLNDTPPSAPPQPHTGGSAHPIAALRGPESARGSDAGVNNVGGSVRPPVLVHDVSPQYTESARKAKLSGNVIVGLIVDTNGDPQDVRVEKGLGNELDQKAVEAVQQYRFSPGTKNGEPVAVALKVLVNFQIF